MSGDQGPVLDVLLSMRYGLFPIRVDMMARFDRVESRTTDIRDDMTVSMARGQHARDAAITTRDEIRTEMQRVNEERMLTGKQRRLDARIDDLEKAPTPRGAG